MIELREALTLLDGEIRRLPKETVELSSAHQRYLADDATSDVDVPPHRKSLVDGYAVCSADFDGKDISLEVIDEVVAGGWPRTGIGRGQAIRIMTGAAVPTGADAVVMVEQTVTTDDGRVILRGDEVKPVQNLMEKATIMHRGQVVVPSGQWLDAATIGLLAEIGHGRVAVSKRPTVSLVTTGNELVAPSEKPGPGQIRNSNAPMLATSVHEAGARLIGQRHAVDEPDSLREAIADGLSGDVLVLSGGVSAGVLDLVPGELKQQGVQEIFHRVSLKPGKPIWFGVLDTGSHRCLVFGLPGNPVSSLVCFHLFVRRAIHGLMGGSSEFPACESYPLATAFHHRGNRPTWWPARVIRTEGGLSQVEPLEWRGSGDLRALAFAEGWIGFSPGTKSHEAGTQVDFIRR